MCVSNHFNLSRYTGGLETDNPQWGHILMPVNWFCLAVFTLEVAVKLVALKGNFWVDTRDAAWNRFDFTIVAISIIDFIVSAAGSKTNTGGIVVVVRVFR